MAFDRQYNKSLLFNFQIVSRLIEARADLDSETEIVEMQWTSNEVHCFEVEHLKSYKPNFGNS